jgi:hypothetical protein
VTGVSEMEQATQNVGYLRVLLLEKEPAFLAVLELAVSRVDRELCDDRSETA